MISYSASLKNEVDYYPLPNGTVDVYLRKRLPDEVDAEGNNVFVYDEVSVNTTLPKSVIEEYFDLLFDDPSALDTPVVTQPSAAERIEMLENTLLQMMFM